VVLPVCTAPSPWFTTEIGKDQGRGYRQRGKEFDQQDQASGPVPGVGKEGLAGPECPQTHGEEHADSADGEAAQQRAGGKPGLPSSRQEQHHAGAGQQRAGLKGASRRMGTDRGLLDKPPKAPRVTSAFRGTWQDTLRVAAALERIVYDEDYKKNLIERGYQTVSQYSCQHFIQGHLNQYNNNSV